MNTGRLLRLSIVIASMVPISACQQGATVGPYPSGAVTPTPTPRGTTPTATPTGGASATATPTATASAAPSATASATASAAPTATASPSAVASATAAVGPLVIAPDPTNFGVLSVLGATMTANISQAGYTGAFTLPANPVICAGGLVGDVPITPSITGSTLTITLGALGVNGVCTITVDGAPGTSGTETVNLAVPVGTPPNAGAFTFNPDPIDFDVVAAVAGSTKTTTVSETGYTGAFTLPANPVSCPFNLLPLTQLAASISGTTVTVTTGTLNANLLGSCTVTVDDAAGNSGQFGVNFQLL